MEARRVTRPLRKTDTFRWRLAIGAILIVGGYGAWLIIPLVVGSDLTPSIKTALTAVLGATPLLTKLLAIALLGRPNDRLPKKAFSNCFFDEMIPVQNSYWLSANLPNAVLLTYPNSGHGSLFQFHEFFTRQAAAFLASDSEFAPY